MTIFGKLKALLFIGVFTIMAALMPYGGTHAANITPDQPALTSGALLKGGILEQQRHYSPVVQDMAQFCVGPGGGCNARACPGGEGGCQANCCNGLVCLSVAGIAACRGGGADGR